MQSKRLGCLTGIGSIAILITAIIIASYVYASGGLIFNPGPLNAKSGEPRGGVTSHAEIGKNCKACHAAPWESEKMADRCAVCHNEIATEMQKAASMHGRVMHDNPGLTCRHCHPEHQGPNAKSTVMEGGFFPHEVVGYLLNGHRLTTNQNPFTCDDCHHGDISIFITDTCQTCHSQINLTFTQAHLLDFGTDCLACHDGVDRYGDDFSHARFAFQLTGKHTSLPCAQCHPNARSILDLQSLSQDCLACHQKVEPHESRFGSDCATCHSTAGWKPAKFDHNLALFKLEGSHEEVACESCHQNGSYKGTPTNCFACHEKDDRHNGKFGKDCAACHQPTKWEDVTFDHNRSKFPLTGRHTNLACEQCHTTGQFAGLSAFCASCHIDPAFHTGLFGLDCAQCHTTNNWAARYNGPHPGIADEGGSGVNHGGASCRDCHTQTLHTATCAKCHEGNNPENGGEGGGGDG